MRTVLWPLLVMCGYWLVGGAGAATVKAGDMALEVDSQGRVTGLQAAGQKLPVRPEALVSLAEAGGQGYVAATVTGGDLNRGLQLDFGPLGATAVMKVTAHGEALRFECDLQGAERPDRGLMLRFALPVQAVGWQWHDDMQTRRTITADKTFENVVPLRAYADLPEWADQPALRLGYSNRNFCSVITGPVGLSLAVPLDRPCLFHTSYSGQNQRLEHVYEFALSPLTREPRRVRFSFDLYSCDPAWGLRSALQRYYRMYPDMFKVYVSEQGQWMAFSKLSEIDNVNEFYFALQEGAPEPEYDDKINVLSTVYYTHAGMPGNFPPPYDPEKDPLPPYEEQVKAMERAFKSAMGQDGIYEKVGTRKADGKLAVEKWKVYAHLIAQFNPDPDLPYGEHLIKNTITRTDWYKEKRGAKLDGFYYDGLTSGLNYAPEHFKTADAPLIWNPVEQKPFLNNFFSSVEFARGTAELLRPRGQITMMNGALGESFYVVPWLDILGAETGLRIPRSDFNYIRTVIYHKPFMTLLKGNYEKQIGQPEMELFMKRCLAYGVFPGFFDWPPSGLGPGGRYWDHPRYYERDRDLFRKYQPLCRSLALAGWEPVTHARSSNPEVYVERYGPAADGVVWLSLLNEGKQAQATRLTIASRALGLPRSGVQAVDLVSGRTVALSAQGETLTAELTVEPEGVMALQLAAPLAAARWRLAQARETVQRGALMRRVDAGKGPVAVHWLPAATPYERRQEGDETRLALAATADRGTSCRQWAMLFQPNPSPVTLKVKVRAQDLKAGQALVRCRIAWVTANYTHYRNVDLPLPEGTYDWRELTLTLPDDQALRAVQIIPTINQGKPAQVEFSRITLSDASRSDYVIDSEFGEWYEPLPAALSAKLEPAVESLDKSLAALHQALQATPTPAARPALEAVCRQLKGLQREITQAGAEQACRRLQRDLQTVAEHLGPVGLRVYGFTLPSLTAPAVVAAGEQTPVAWGVTPVKGVALRTELSAEGGEVVTRGGRSLLTVPANTPPGTAITLRGQLHLGPPGAELSLASERRLTVVTPLELNLENRGADATTGTVRVAARVTNHRRTGAQVQLAVTSPAGWQAAATTPLKVVAGGSAEAELRLTPTAGATAGAVEFMVTAQAGADRISRRLSVLHLPPELNLVQNPGFEEGAAKWAVSGGKSGPQTTGARSGQGCVRLDNPAPTDSQASQSINLNQKLPAPVLVRVAARAEQVSGEANRGFSLYVDLYYTDGTPRYGIIYPFQTGTTDWQLGELYIEPAKPIRNVNVYLLLRGKSGQATFDDVAVMEDPRRQGNLARTAKVSADSNYSGYDPSPLNDGVTQIEGLHWTKEAWASAEKDTDHWIELTLPAPAKLGQARIYWSLDGETPKTSQEVQIQVAEGEGWRTVATVRPPDGEAQTEISWPGVMTERLRVWQPRGRGPVGREHLMWVREVELYQTP